MKIARNTYRFVVGNETYRAVFSHEHVREGEQPIRIGSVKAQHITTCLLGLEEHMDGITGGMSALTGVAICSVKDTYSRLFGMRTALERCLLAKGFEFTYEKNSATGRKEIKFKTQFHREQYGKFMNAFFSGLRSDSEVRKAA